MEQKRISKKEMTEAIVQAMLENGIKDFMTGAVTYTWNPTRKKDEYSIRRAAENVYNLLNFKKK